MPGGSPTEITPRKSGTVAVVGSGVSGLTAAHVLNKRHQVILFEADSRLGGHAHTHQLAAAQGNLRVDTGFIVHNTRTYPVLLRLFAELGIKTRDTEMSMSIHDEASGLEYAGGRGAQGFLSRPSQLLNPRFTRMLLHVRRFHRLATEFLHDSTADDTTTYGEFLDQHQFSADFVRLYAVPVVACVWSTGNTTALAYPARYLFQFLRHHGMLEVGNSPQWRTVVGGSGVYVEKLAAELDQVHRNTAVAAVHRTPTGIEIRDRQGQLLVVDKVVIATHPDQALTLLADATPAEKEVLGAFRYSTNPTVLHQDPSLMPKTPAVRSAWNYRTPLGAPLGTPLGTPLGSALGTPLPDRAAAQTIDPAPVVTYWMNRLQGLAEQYPLYVTLNATDRVRPETILAEMTYRHPIYDLPAVAAQRRLSDLNTSRTAFAGAYHGWGFHEDGARSGQRAAEALGVSW